MLELWGHHLVVLIIELEDQSRPCVKHIAHVAHAGAQGNQVQTAKTFFFGKMFPPVSLGSVSPIQVCDIYIYI